MNTGLGAYVLLAGESLIAFFAIEHSADVPSFTPFRLREDDTALELARLVVDKKERVQGYGTSLFMHVYKAFMDTYSESAPFHFVLRQDRTNNISSRFFSRLPVSYAHVAQPSNYIWYIFSDSARYMHAGTAVSKRRKDIERLTQQKLAFLACMDTSTLAMVETGHRVLRVDDASRLRDILCATPEDELRYAKDVLACTFNPALWSYPSTLGTELADVHQTLWVFSDTLAENTTSIGIRLSSEALLSGCDRFFFVPQAYPTEDIANICRLFVRHFDNNSLDKGIITERVRFYRSPTSLCQLRLAVHDPDPGSFSARKMSVAAGDREMRLDIAHRDDPLITRFIQYITQQLLYMDLPQGGVSEGFIRIGDYNLDKPNGWSYC